MTDRDLLEMAAKAACKDHRGYTDRYYDPGLLEVGGDAWNSLTDECAAMWLAGVLRIDIEWETEFVVFADGNFSEDIKDHNNDPVAAICRAVTRAAAYRAEDAARSANKPGAVD